MDSRVPEPSTSFSSPQNVSFRNVQEGIENCRPGHSGWSPPTKWPRASTPRRRDSLLGCSIDSGYSGNDSVSMHSPPLNQSPSSLPPNKSPLLRTPTNSMNRTTSMITPSPMRSRSYLSHSVSSPSISSKPLRLSNPHNSTGFNFRECELGPHGAVEVTSIRKVNRCLQMPEATTNGNEDSSSLMLCGVPSSPSRDISPDRTLPYHINIETPSKSLEQELDDSGLFSLSTLQHSPSNLCVSGYSSLTSIHRIPEMTSGPLETSIFESAPELAVRQVFSSPEPTTDSPPRKKIGKGKEKKISSPFHPLCHSTPMTSIGSDNKSEILSSHTLPLPSTPLTTVSFKSKRRREEYQGERFQSPKKPLKPFGRRWLRIVYGTTSAQRELTTAAHEFMKRLEEERRESTEC